MTVADLIKELEKQPQDHRILIASGEYKGATSWATELTLPGFMDDGFGQKAVLIK